MGRDREVAIVLEDFTKLYAEIKGDVTMVFQDKSSLTMKDCIYVPNMRRKIEMTYCSYEDWFHTDFSDRASIMKNEKEVCQALVVNGIYVLHLKALVKPPK